MRSLVQHINESISSAKDTEKLWKAEQKEVKKLLAKNNNFEIVQSYMDGYLVSLIDPTKRSYDSKLKIDIFDKADSNSLYYARLK